MQIHIILVSEHSLSAQNKQTTTVQRDPAFKRKYVYLILFDIGELRLKAKADLHLSL